MKHTFSLLVLVFFLAVSCGDKSNSSTTTASQDTRATSMESKAPAEKQGQAYVDDGVSAKNALQVAQSLPDFSTLVAAINAAGVENAVVNAGPLTIFAPLNSAFDKLPEGTVATLVKPENKAKLSHILTNHVAPANYPLKQLKKEAKKGRKLYMASGVYLDVVNKDDGIYVGGTKVLKTVQVSNGWIHVIDDVLVPAG